VTIRLFEAAECQENGVCGNFRARMPCGRSSGQSIMPGRFRETALMPKKTGVKRGSAKNVLRLTDLDPLQDVSFAKPRLGRLKTDLCPRNQ
jgi:hypothetical protein